MELQDVLSRHTEVFKNGLGLVKGMSAEIHVGPQAPPRFFKARSVLYALRGKVEQELERLERDSIIQQFDPAPCDKKCRSERQTLFLLFGGGVWERD